MLIQFLVENFLSFKDETVFSMRAPPGEPRAVDVPGHQGLRLMRAAAFYGANASGKSNLVFAFEAARDLISRGHADGSKLRFRPFRLTPEYQSKPSRFQFDFILHQIRYSYTLMFHASEIVGEALYRTLPGRDAEELVYEREVSGQNEPHRVEFGPTLLTGDDEQKQFARFVAKGTPIEQPLLAEFASRNVLDFHVIRNWFRDGLITIGASALYVNLVKALSENLDLRTFCSEMLANMGTGIREIRVSKELDAKLGAAVREIEGFDVEKRKALEEFISMFPMQDDGVGIEKTVDGTNRLELKFVHGTRAGTTVNFPINEESDGTRRLLHLLPILFYRTNGACTVIDELDRSLHTALTRRFVEQFMAMASDNNPSQLIFTTHDTNLLNGRLLPAASIWFVEKDDDGASHLHSLADYRSEQLEQLLEHLEDGYLQGRFGAIPFLAHRDHLAWETKKEPTS